MNNQIRVFLTAFHELKEKHRHVTPQMVYMRIGLAETTIQGWARKAEQRHGIRLLLDTENALKRQRVINRAREHFGDKATGTLQELSKLAKVSPAVVASMVAEGYLQVSRDSVDRHRFVINATKDYPCVELPQPDFRFTVEQWNEMPRLAPKKENQKRKYFRSDALYLIEKENRENEKDNTMLAVYFAVGKHGHDGNGWTVEEIAATADRPVDTAQNCLNHIAKLKGSEALIETVKSDNATRYRLAKRPRTEYRSDAESRTFRTLGNYRGDRRVA